MFEDVYAALWPSFVVRLGHRHDPDSEHAKREECGFNADNYSLFYCDACILQIRVTSSDWNELMNLLGEIRKQEHLDAEFVFLKLRFDRAFQFVATKNEVRDVA